MINSPLPTNSPLPVRIRCHSSGVSRAVCKAFTFQKARYTLQSMFNIEVFFCLSKNLWIRQEPIRKQTQPNGSEGKASMENPRREVWTGLRQHKGPVTPGP